jgi:hypothetical protein
MVPAPITPTVLICIKATAELAEIAENDFLRVLCALCG